MDLSKNFDSEYLAKKIDTFLIEQLQGTDTFKIFRFVEKRLTFPTATGIPVSVFVKGDILMNIKSLLQPGLNFKWDIDRKLMVNFTGVTSIGSQEYKLPNFHRDLMLHSDKRFTLNATKVGNNLTFTLDRPTKKFSILRYSKRQLLMIDGEEMNMPENDSTLVNVPNFYTANAFSSNSSCFFPKFVDNLLGFKLCQTVKLYNFGSFHPFFRWTALGNPYSYEIYAEPIGVKYSKLTITQSSRVEATCDNDKYSHTLTSREFDVRYETDVKSRITFSRQLYPANDDSCDDAYKRVYLEVKDSGNEFNLEVDWSRAKPKVGSEFETLFKAKVSAPDGKKKQKLDIFYENKGAIDEKKPSTNESFYRRRTLAWKLSFDKDLQNWIYNGTAAYSPLFFNLESDLNCLDCLNVFSDSYTRNVSRYRFALEANLLSEKRWTEGMSDIVYLRLFLGSIIPKNWNFSLIVTGLIYLPNTLTIDLEALASIKDKKYPLTVNYSWFLEPRTSNKVVSIDGRYNYTALELNERHLIRISLPGVRYLVATNLTKGGNNLKLNFYLDSNPKNYSNVQESSPFSASYKMSMDKNVSSLSFYKGNSVFTLTSPKITLNNDWLLKHNPVSKEFEIGYNSREIIAGKFALYAWFKFSYSTLDMHYNFSYYESESLTVNMIGFTNNKELIKKKFKDESLYIRTDSGFSRSQYDSQSDYNYSCTSKINFGNNAMASKQCSVHRKIYDSELNFQAKYLTPTIQKGSNSFFSFTYSRSFVGKVWALINTTLTLNIGLISPLRQFGNKFSLNISDFGMIQSKGFTHNNGTYMSTSLFYYYNMSNLEDGIHLAFLEARWLSSQAIAISVSFKQRFKIIFENYLRTKFDVNMENIYVSWYYIVSSYTTILGQYLNPIWIFPSINPITSSYNEFAYNPDNYYLKSLPDLIPENTNELVNEIRLSIANLVIINPLNLWFIKWTTLWNRISSITTTRKWNIKEINDLSFFQILYHPLRWPNFTHLPQIEPDDVKIYLTYFAKLYQIPGFKFWNTARNFGLNEKPTRIYLRQAVIMKDLTISFDGSVSKLKEINTENCISILAHDIYGKFTLFQRGSNQLTLRTILGDLSLIFENENDTLKPNPTSTHVHYITIKLNERNVETLPYLLKGYNDSIGLIYMKGHFLNIKFAGIELICEDKHLYHTDMTCVLILRYPKYHGSIYGLLGNNDINPGNDKIYTNIPKGIPLCSYTPLSSELKSQVLTETKYTSLCKDAFDDWNMMSPFYACSQDVPPEPFYQSCITISGTQRERGICKIASLYRTICRNRNIILPQLNYCEDAKVDTFLFPTIWKGRIKPATFDIIFIVSTDSKNTTKQLILDLALKIETILKSDIKYALLYDLNIIKSDRAKFGKRFNSENIFTTSYYDDVLYDKINLAKILQQPIDLEPTFNELETVINTLSGYPLRDGSIKICIHLLSSNTALNVEQYQRVLKVLDNRGVIYNVIGDGLKDILITQYLTQKTFGRSFDISDYYKENLKKEWLEKFGDNIGTQINKSLHSNFCNVCQNILTVDGILREQCKAFRIFC
ncbi:uncharacterized protein LOC135928814 [Gordionus sp. m RMFG-2023]|uniref:uncharacterized protein LOC135928814 n=1 Tax=Gordionus sp. m RMFG-2023 TaxID=3053472 RepID=UPI0031FC1D7D